MRYSCWICWFFWEGLPTLMAYPLSLPVLTDTQQDSQPGQWERYWFRYVIGSLGIGIAVFMVVGCLCCRRYQRPKGFEDKTGNCKQEFKDGTIGHERGFDEPFRGLELQIPRTASSNDRIQFEPILVERIVPDEKTHTKIKQHLPSSPLSPTSPLSSLSAHEQRSGNVTLLEERCRDWFDATELHVSREKFKYLREIGHGWFGKVVEGRAELEEDGIIAGGVVVRILTEEATAKEKAWFLGEAKPYLKLRHPNILALIGFCLDTDPYLLLFESCPAGDLKGFLLSIGDQKSREALFKENVPTRMAIEVADGLRHMHEHGFAHTDLSARNCLVAADLSVKLGDYGTAVEKYPTDYYVVGDRALPIRWSAPESLECTDTTIETREITTLANIWSYGILLWEMLAWGERPYDDMEDERVIEMLLSLRNGFAEAHTRKLQDRLAAVAKVTATERPPNVILAIQSCLRLGPSDRPSLDLVRRTLLNEQPHTDQEDFERRWESLRPNAAPEHRARSASLQDLRGSVDSDYWTNVMEERIPASFRLGPQEPPVKNVPGLRRLGDATFEGSGSETEEESWRARVERGVYSEKVKQKSKSVADLMVLVHIDPDSDAEWSIPGIQSTDRITGKCRPTAAGSDSDLTSVTHNAMEFNETVKKLRAEEQRADYRRCNDKEKETLERSPHERPKLLTLTTDRGNDTPILRLTVGCDEQPCRDKEYSSDDTEMNRVPPIETSPHVEGHLLRLVSKGNPDFSVLRYVPSTGDDAREKSTHSDVDVVLWNRLLDSALERKTAELSDASYRSDPRVPCATDDLEVERKRLSTPDDERSSDSGFRDKESCEEEESPPSVVQLTSNTDEEQLRILFELDTILDAEYYCGMLSSADGTAMPNSGRTNSTELDVTTSPNQNGLTQRKVNESPTNRPQARLLNRVDSGTASPGHHYESRNGASTEVPTDLYPEGTVAGRSSRLEFQNENEDDDSSTMSLRSDNSYVSFAMEEEFVAAIRNELREKLPRAQMSVIEPAELQDEDNNIPLEKDSKRWNDNNDIVDDNENDNENDHDYDDDDNDAEEDYDGQEEIDTDVEDSPDRRKGSIDVSIRYNVYGAPLSPILEERESTVTTESVLSNSIDTSTGSKTSVTSEDVLVVDTRTNEMIILEACFSDRLREKEDRETTSGDISEEEVVEDGLSMMTSTTTAITSPIMTTTTMTTTTVTMTMTMTRPTTTPTTTTTTTTTTIMTVLTADGPIRVPLTIGGAPLPSPEDEGKWNKQLGRPFPLPVPLSMQDDLMSTSFASEHSWGSHEEDEENPIENEDDSSSSGEFVWKRYNEPQIEHNEVKTELEAACNEETTTIGTAGDVMTEDADGEDGEDEEEEFTPSAWNASLAPHRSALRSPDKTVKSGDQKKSVWFKKQRYHCVYEYPKESSTSDSHGEISGTTWESTLYTDWEETVDEPKLDLYSLDYDDSNDAGDEEFYVSSSSRPFQFQTGDSKYVSQFFPGASSDSMTLQGESGSTDHVDGAHSDGIETTRCNADENAQQLQLGELRHTRDRLKLNLVPSSGVGTTIIISAKEYNVSTDLHLNSNVFLSLGGPSNPRNLPEDRSLFIEKLTADVPAKDVSISEGSVEESRLRGSTIKEKEEEKGNA